MLLDYQELPETEIGICQERFWYKNKPGLPLSNNYLCLFCVIPYMKSNRLLLGALLGCAILTTAITSACKKESTAFEHSTMRPWFDSKCSSCHGKGGSNRIAWAYDPDDYTGSIKSKISKIYSEVYNKKSMPPGGATQAELDAFKAWYDAGYPAK
jgi:hypothetical protein